MACILHHALMYRAAACVQRCARALVYSTPSVMGEAAVTKVSSAQGQLSVSRIATPTLPLNNGRQRVVVLGTGWGAARLLSDLNTKLYNITVCPFISDCLWTNTFCEFGHVSLVKSLKYPLRSRSC
jgi:hypothetical protein